MVRHTAKILQPLLQDFGSVSDHIGTLCNKGSLNPFVPRCSITEKFRSYVFFIYCSATPKGYYEDLLQANSCNFNKKELPTEMFSINFANFLRTPFSTERFR